VYAVTGGFHLGGPLFEPLIPHVCAELGKLSPGVIVPGTAPDGLPSAPSPTAFPAAFIQNTVGTRFEL
jgi:7,8-dihydropterin-6-yl-methyl-4-(beta-D-ribofuranosyl)aminobenzene 5'-phosphate synthase